MSDPVSRYVPLLYLSLDDVSHLPVLHFCHVPCFILFVFVMCFFACIWTLVLNAGPRSTGVAELTHFAWSFSTLFYAFVMFDFFALHNVCDSQS